MYRLTKPLLLIFWIFTYAYPSSARTVLLLNEENGLGNVEVKAVTKDKYGCIWVATKGGLYTYDGSIFRLFPTLEKQNIHALLFDSSRNYLWVGTEHGLKYIDCNNRAVFSYYGNSSEQNAAISIAEFKGQIVIGFRNNLILSILPNFKPKVLFRFTQKQLKKNTLHIDKNGHILAYFEPTRELVSVDIFTAKAISVHNSHPNQSIHLVYSINDQYYVGGVDKGIWRVGSDNKMLKAIDTLNLIQQDLEVMLEHHQSIYFAYRNETAIYELKTNTSELTNLSKNNKAIFTNKRINCLYADEHNILWIGTDKGLIMMVPEKPKPHFKKLFWNQKNRVSTRQIIEDSYGNIIIASYAGLIVLNPKTNQYTKLDSVLYKGKKNPFWQRSLLLYNDTTLYTGSDASVFFKLNPRIKNTATNIQNKVECPGQGSTLSLAKDDKGKVWLGTENGLVSYEPSSNQFVCHQKTKFDVGSTPVKDIVMLPNKKQFWAGTENGIFLIDVNLGILKHFNENSTPALSSNNINVIRIDSRGNIWIGTEDSGVNVLSANFKTVNTISKEDGLSNNEVYNILWQDSNAVWISTYNGLNYYQTQTQTVLSYFEKDGIANNEFNQNSAFKSNDGTFYFGGINGITYFKMPKFNLQVNPFKLFISGVSKWEKSSGKIIGVNYKATKQIVMEPGDNLLTFSFGASDYSDLGLYNYLYKIEGLHDNWVSIGKQPILRLESLKEGKYNLYVKAIKGKQGEESINTEIIQLHFKQYFYQSTWFYIALSLMIGLLLYFYFTNQLKNQKKLESLRVQIASNLHDDVGSTLTRITLLADRLIYQTNKNNEMQSRLKKVAELSRSANSAMSDVLWSIDARNDITISLTDRMREHAEDLLVAKGIETTIDFYGVELTEKLSPHFRQQLFLIYKEIINNITKHSEANEVSIVYKQAKKTFLLHVKNNGVIKKDDSIITGQGLRNIEMRAELIKAYATIKKDEKNFEVTVSNEYLQNTKGAKLA